jgi:hypothetical protein
VTPGTLLACMPARVRDPVGSHLGFHFLTHFSQPFRLRNFAETASARWWRREDYDLLDRL